MKKTPEFYLKTLLLFVGGFLLLLSSFMSTIDKSVLDFSMNNQSPTKITGGIVGFHCLLWYMILLGTVIIFAIGYFFNNTINRILVSVFTPIFAIGIMFFTFVFTFSIAIDPGDPILMLGNGYTVTIFGALLVIVATFISVFQPKAIQKKVNQELLDD